MNIICPACNGRGIYLNHKCCVCGGCGGLLGVKGKDLGTLSQALLRGLLKEKSPKNPQDLNPIGFWVLSLRCADFGVAVYVLRIPAAPRPIPPAGLAKRLSPLAPLPDRKSSG